MFAVGIAQLAGSVDQALPGLARGLGMTAYDARMLLSPGIPALVLATPDKQKALSLLAHLRSEGHDALAFDTSAVISSSEMVSPRIVAIEPTALVPRRPQGAPLWFEDVGVMLRATHETAVDATEETTKRKFSAGRAMLTGGVVMTKKKTQTSSSHAYDKHEVLYVFAPGGKPPWLIRDTGTRYEGLGEKLAATERANFLTVVDLLRKGAPAAVYDERLVGRKIPERLARIAVQGMGSPQARIESSNDAAMDMLAHFVAMWHVKQQSTGESR